jgi:Flp pilus assembly protein TadB
VSKERARRRAEREAAERLTAARAARRARWNVLARVRRARQPASPRPARPGKPSSALGRHRARQNGVLLAALVAVDAVYWLIQPAWAWRLGAVVATALAWPLLVVVLFDRRSSR